MVRRVVTITIVQIVLYVTLIPMRVAYEVHCQRPGSRCGSPFAPSSARSGTSLAFKAAPPSQ